jgi:hypothetical protein
MLTLKADMSEADLDVAGRLNPTQGFPRKRKKIEGLTQKEDPYHDAVGRFASSGTASTGLPPTDKWGFSSSVGNKVRVDDPTSEHHGKTGEVNRQVGHSHSVVFDKGGTDWFNSGQLKTISEHSPEPDMKDIISSISKEVKKMDLVQKTTLPPNQVAPPLYSWENNSAYQNEFGGFNQTIPDGTVPQAKTKKRGKASSLQV